MRDDAELLRRYACEKSEAAFAELVQRHVNFVYASALRRVGGDAHLAEDVTQQVFTALARSAASLAQHPVLSGWLYTTTRNAAAQVVRTERRRQTREQEAHSMNELTSSPARDAEWERLRPVLDGAMDELSEADRQAVLLRFFEGKSFADVAAKLHLTENTARMRVERALDKLHAQLARRGVTSTTAALGLALGSQAAIAAPVGLVASVTTAALAQTAISSGAAGMGLFNLMAASKTMAGMAGVLIVLSLATALYELREVRRLDGLLSSAVRQQEDSQALVRSLERRLAEETKRYREAEADNGDLLKVAGGVLATAEARNSLPNGGPLNHVAVQARYGRAIELARSGDHATALEEYLWCFDDGMPRVSTFRIARRGALLDAMAKLGQQHPEALAALRSRRDLAEQAMLGSPYEMDSVADFVALNRVLNDTGRTLAQFDQLPADDPRHEAIASLGFEQFVTAQRYRDAARAKSYAQMDAQFETAARQQPPVGAANQAMIRRDAHDVAVRSAANSIEVLAGAGDLAHARILAQKLLAFDGSEPIKALLRTRLARAGQPQLLDAFP